MLNIIVAFFGSVLTGLQTVLIVMNKEAICFNDGCSIVESLTKVPPFFFNLAGFLYFSTIFYVLVKARKGPDAWRQFASLLLLAGMAAEGVLVAFQHFIVEVFCSYCLVVFCFVVALNLFAGFKQFFRGVATFAAVIIAFSVLQFSSPQIKPISTGTYGTIAGEQSQGKLVLFFSETCVHCEEVIEGLRENNSCQIQFNPIGPIFNWEFEGLQKNTTYDPAHNISFLANLGINEIPVMAVYENNSVSVLKGKFAIKDYLAKNCSGVEVVLEEQSTIGQSSSQDSFSAPDGQTYLFDQEEENCGIPGSTSSEDCN